MQYWYGMIDDRGDYHGVMFIFSCCAPVHVKLQACAGLASEKNENQQILNYALNFAFSLLLWN